MILDSDLTMPSRRIYTMKFNVNADFYWLIRLEGQMVRNNVFWLISLIYKQKVHPLIFF